MSRVNFGTQQLDVGILAPSCDILIGAASFPVSGTTVTEPLPLISVLQVRSDSYIKKNQVKEKKEG